MTPATSTITLNDFRQAIDKLDVHRPLTAPRYARRKVMATAGSFCALCDKQYDYSNPRGFDYPVIASCVHPLLGGPLTVDNLFTCCRRCQQSRSSSDLLSYPNLPDHLLDQRAAVLMLSDNHLLDLPPSATMSDVRASLRARHALPRARVYAAQTDDGTCLVGVSSRYGDAQANGLANFLSGAVGSLVFEGKRLRVYQLSDNSFRSAVWELIEANALVVGLSRRSVLRDRLDYWWLTSASVGELRLGKVAGIVVPFDTRRKKVGPRALRARRLTARRKLERELGQAQSILAQADEQVEALRQARTNPWGNAFPTDPEEALALLRHWALATERVEQLREELGQAHTRRLNRS